MRCMNRDDPSAKLEDGLREVAIGVLLAVMETYVTCLTWSTCHIESTRHEKKYENLFLLVLKGKKGAFTLLKT